MLPTSNKCKAARLGWWSPWDVSAFLRSLVQSSLGDRQIGSCPSEKKFLNLASSRRSSWIRWPNVPCDSLLQRMSCTHKRRLGCSSPSSSSNAKAKAINCNWFAIVSFSLSTSKSNRRKMIITDNDATLECMITVVKVTECSHWSPQKALKRRWRRRFFLKKEV